MLIIVACAVVVYLVPTSKMQGFICSFRICFKSHYLLKWTNVVNNFAGFQADGLALNVLMFHCSLLNDSFNFDQARFMSSAECFNHQREITSCSISSLQNNYICLKKLYKEITVKFKIVTLLENFELLTVHHSAPLNMSYASDHRKS